MTKQGPSPDQNIKSRNLMSDFKAMDELVNKHLSENYFLNQRLVQQHHNLSNKDAYINSYTIETKNVVISILTLLHAVNGEATDRARGEIFFYDIMHRNLLGKGPA